MARVAVIDYDMGNLHSVCKALARAGVEVEVTDSPGVIAVADGVVLPGVGAFDYAMQQLRSRRLERAIEGAISSGKPFLGICLGLQILFEGSSEGKEPGLGIIPGWVHRFEPEPGLTIPHMGWNQLHLTQPAHPLWRGLGTQPWLYFVHSYYVAPKDSVIVAAAVCHGSQRVTAAIGRGNLFATQFHPEKSAPAGLRMLHNFAEMLTGPRRQLVEIS